MHHFDIYDRPGWNSFTYTFPHWGGIEKRDDGRVVIRFDTADASTYNDDFYFRHYQQVAMVSNDGCHTWQPFEPDWPHLMPLRLSDGTLVEVVEERDLVSRDQQQRRVKDLGIGHVWREDCRLAWDLWPRRMTETLREQGLVVWDRRGSWLPDDVVATHGPSGFMARRSTDAGRTWVQTPAGSLNDFYHVGPCFPGSVVLPDDTLLVPFYAMRRNGPPPPRFTLMGAEIHVLRSTDGGCSFQQILVGGAEEGTHMSEVSLVAHPAGRVVALIRNPEMLCAWSDDGGLTWTRPRSTGIRDTIPMDAIGLADGTILCAGAHRPEPGGIRASISRDAGESWEATTPIILRDDVPPSDFIGGPGSVQLDDGSVFTFYNLVRQEAGRKQPHCYIAGSVYTV